MKINIIKNKYLFNLAKNKPTNGAAKIYIGKKYLT